MKKVKIGIWGQFGEDDRIADGQAVRTKMIYSSLEMEIGEDKIIKVNTNGWKRKRFRLLFETINMCFHCKKIVFAPADNGFKIIIWLLVLLSILFSNKLFFVVIGGFLPKLINKNRLYVDLINRCDSIFVQSALLESQLRDLGLRNIELLTNFKIMKTRDVNEIKLILDKNVKVCTFSRITKDKGIIEAISAVKKLNNSLESDYVNLDIFGVIDKDFEEEFLNHLNANKSFVSYQGVVKYDKTVDVLSEYFALLHPTYYYGEGFSGNIIDSFYAGIPIIATDWMSNSEYVKNGVNGILVKTRCVDELCDAVKRLYFDRELVYKLSLNNLVESEKYQKEVVLKAFFNKLGILSRSNI